MSGQTSLYMVKDTDRKTLTARQCALDVRLISWRFGTVISATGPRAKSSLHLQDPAQTAQLHIERR